MMLFGLDMMPFWLSFKLAGMTTFILFFIALPLAWWLSQTQCKCKPFVEALTALPLVLPPSVLGFYLLYLFSYNTPIGSLIHDIFGVKLVFSFSGLVFASVFYSFPFMVQPLQGGFESLNKNMLAASYIAGKGSMTTLWRVAMPNIKPAVLTALIVTFAHTVGEFGVVLMVGGSIPGETKVASVAIYEAVEIMNYGQAHVYSLMMLVLSFTVLLSVYLFNHRQARHIGIS